MWPAREVDKSVVLVVPNVEVRVEAEHYIPPVSLHDLLEESFAFDSVQSKGYSIEW